LVIFTAIRRASSLLSSLAARLEKMSVPRLEIQRREAAGGQIGDRVLIDGGLNTGVIF
jgi:hypothetical protein